MISGFVTRLTRRVPLVEQELRTLSEHLSSPPIFGEVRVTRSLVCNFFMFCHILLIDKFDFKNSFTLERLEEFEDTKA
jgi:hypothetical protein